MELQYHLNTIDEAAAVFWKHAAQYRVFAFYGEMGAGKTTFIHALCELLGVEEAVSSPTFSIINQYKAKQNELIYHLDLYRLKDAEEAMLAGVEEVLYSGQICLIEWPQKAEQLLPEDTLVVQISILSEKERRLNMQFPH